MDHEVDSAAEGLATSEAKDSSSNRIQQPSDAGPLDKPGAPNSGTTSSTTGVSAETRRSATVGE